MYNYLSIRDINILFDIFVSANISLNKDSMYCNLCTLIAKRQSQQTFNCSKSTIETLEKAVKYVRS